MILGGIEKFKMRKGKVLCSKLLVLSFLFQGVNGNKYCEFEIHGRAMYYSCSRNEHCCRDVGCCLNLSLNFYQLWYYWLLVIFMFMICSGWYRFCRRHRNTTSLTNPTNPSYSSSATNQRSSRPHCHHSERICRHHHHQIQQQQRTRTIHRPCGNSVYYLQRIWKGPNANQQHQLPPSYSTMFLNMITNSSPPDPVARGNQGSRPPPGCPYFQLYGPPPSYDSVIQLTSEGVTSCLVEPIATGAEDEQRASARDDEVNINQDAEETIQEVVISEPRNNNTEREQLSRTGSLISVNCNSQTTQLEEVQATAAASTSESSGMHSSSDDIAAPASTHIACASSSRNVN